MAIFSSLKRTLFSSLVPQVKRTYRILSDSTVKNIPHKFTSDISVGLTIELNSNQNKKKFYQENWIRCQERSRNLLQNQVKGLKVQIIKARNHSNVLFVRTISHKIVCWKIYYFSPWGQEIIQVFHLWQCIFSEAQPGSTHCINSWGEETILMLHLWLWLSNQAYFDFTHYISSWREEAFQVLQLWLQCCKIQWLETPHVISSWW